MEMVLAEEAKEAGVRAGVRVRVSGSHGVFFSLSQIAQISTDRNLDK